MNKTFTDLFIPHNNSDYSSYSSTGLNFFNNYDSNYKNDY